MPYAREERKEGRCDGSEAESQVVSYRSEKPKSTRVGVSLVDRRIFAGLIYHVRLTK